MARIYSPLQGEVGGPIFGAQAGIQFLSYIFYESMVNLRPRQNRSMQILDVTICEQVKTCHPQVIRRSMNNWTGEELAFRCERLSVRMSKLAQNFLQMAVLSVDFRNAEAVLALIRETKGFLELTALDLDVDQGFELAQMQRQLSRVAHPLVRNLGR